MAALLHEIGLYALMAEAPTLMDEVRDRVLATGDTPLAAEAACWDATHADVGAYVLGLWGFEWAIVDAVGQAETTAHGTPPREPRDVVRLAALLCEEVLPLFPETAARALLAAPSDDDSSTLALHASWRALAQGECAALQALDAGDAT
jgi:HD-like signal output (HDOD) protein